MTVKKEDVLIIDGELGFWKVKSDLKVDLSRREGPYYYGYALVEVCSGSSKICEALCPSLDADAPGGDWSLSQRDIGETSELVFIHPTLADILGLDFFHHVNYMWDFIGNLKKALYKPIPSGVTAPELHDFMTRNKFTIDDLTEIVNFGELEECYKLYAE